MWYRYSPPIQVLCTAAFLCYAGRGRVVRRGAVDRRSHGGISETFGFIVPFVVQFGLYHFSCRVPAAASCLRGSGCCIRVESDGWDHRRISAGASWEIREGSDLLALDR
jgi:hypothetical protein